MKLRDIVTALPSLKKLSAMELPLRTLYHVNKMLKALDTELLFYDAEQKKIVEKYADKSTGRIPESKIPEADQALNVLLDMEVEVVLSSVSIPFSEEIRLSSNDVEALSPFVSVDFGEV